MAIGLLVGGLANSPAQQVHRLADLFTHVWRYNDSGTDQGTDWRGNNFNDTSWPAGMGLFGVETSFPFPYAPAGFPAVDVPLTLMAPGSNSPTVTYYFRTHFTTPAWNPTGLVLRLTNFLDDGAVIFLNGIEAARFRVPSNQNFQTTSPGPVSEGLADIANLATAPLRAGDNVLAVEVHQNASSTDIAFALSLTALVPEPLVVTRPPQSRTNIAGTSATFNVEAAGGPVSYQWLKDGVPLPGGQASTYEFPQVQMSHAGRYSVRLTNAVSQVESAEATLTVVPDTFGPKLVSAVVFESGMTNRIIVTFSERLLTSTAAARENYRLTRLATGASVIISNAAYNLNSQVQLVLGGPDWVLGEDYVLTVNNVRDASAAGNVIAPDSQIGVGWPQVTRVLSPDHRWDFHTAATFDPDIFDDPWWEIDYEQGSWWAEGVGIFCGGPVFNAPCFGEFRTEIGFQPEPSLFRTTFQWPPHLDVNARLRIGLAADDGAVIYVNGVELVRTNLPAGMVRASMFATNASALTICSTQIIAGVKLRPGTNWIAAAVCQAANAPEGDTVFGLILDVLHERTSSVPSGPRPELRLSPQEGHRVQLSWSGAGFALESSPTLNDTNSAPIGPWVEVPDMANPFTTPAGGPQRFYRLRK